jgi:hypothetical protein
MRLRRDKSLRYERGELLMKFHAAARSVPPISPFLQLQRSSYVQHMQKDLLSFFLCKPVMISHLRFPSGKNRIRKDQADDDERCIAVAYRGSAPRTVRQWVRLPRHCLHNYAQTNHLFWHNLCSNSPHDNGSCRHRQRSCLHERMRKSCSCRPWNVG